MVSLILTNFSLKVKILQQKYTYFSNNILCENLKLFVLKKSAKCIKIIMKYEWFNPNKFKIINYY